MKTRTSPFSIFSLVALLSAAGVLNGASLLLDGNFNSLSIGLNPNAYEPAGNWQFPFDYVTDGVAETRLDEFTIVPSPEGFDDDRSLQLFATSDVLESQHLPNLFLQPVTAEEGKVLVVTFDLYVFDGYGGGAVYLGSGGYGFNDRGPQVLWSSSGEILAAQGTTITVLGTYPSGVWQTIRLQVDLNLSTYNLYTKLREATDFELQGENLRFRGLGLASVDRFTIARFNFDPEVFSCFDNVTIESGYPPVILQDLAHLSVPNGTPCTDLTVVAQGEGPLSYQWYTYDEFYDETNILTDFTSESKYACEWDEESYIVKVSNQYGSVFSHPGSVTHERAPSIGQQPNDLTVQEGGVAQLYAWAWGSPTPTYQWQRGLIDVPGMTNNNLLLTNVQSSDAGNYRVVASNRLGSVTSSVAILTVIPRVPPVPPTITTHPLSQTAGIGTTASFNVTATGTAPLVYFWKHIGQTISTGGAASLAFANVTWEDAGAYTVVVSNSFGATTSMVAFLTVNAPIGFERIATSSDTSFPGTVNDLCVNGDHAYVGGERGLAVFDISHPNDPQMVGKLLTSNSVVSVAVNPSTQKIGLAQGSAGLEMADISSPSKPVSLYKFVAPGPVEDVVLASVDALVALGDAGLQVFDENNSKGRIDLWNILPVITNRVVGVRTFEDPATGSWTHACAVGEGLRIIYNWCTWDCSVYEVGYNMECQNARAVDVADGFAYVADDWTGMLIANIQNPSQPSTVARYLTDGSVVNVSALQGKAYLSKRATGFSSANGLEIVDVSNPGSPKKLGTNSLVGQLQSVAVVPPFAFGASSDRGFLTINVSNAANPQI